MKTVISKFNGLNGKIVSREKIEKIRLEAVQNDVSVVAIKLNDLLKNNPNADEFELTVKKIIEQTGLKGTQHKGIAKKALDNCGRLKEGHKFNKGGKIVKVEEKNDAPVKITNKTVPKKADKAKSKVTRKKTVASVKLTSKNDTKILIGVNRIKRKKRTLFRPTINDLTFGNINYIRKWEALKVVKEWVEKNPKEFVLKKINEAKKKKKEKGLRGSINSGNKTERINKITVAKSSVRTTRQKDGAGLNGDLKPVPNLGKKLGFYNAATVPEKASGIFRLPNAIGEFLQDLQRYKALILIKGTKHTSKSQLTMQIANAFGEMGEPVAYIDYEQGGMDSKDTVDSINRNTTPKGRKNIYVIGHLENPLQDLEEIVKQFKVIVADSVTDLKLTADQLNYLRGKYPKTIWIFISQVKENGAMYGGNKMAHNPTLIIHIDPSENFEDRIATLEKNRGNDLSLKYNIFHKELVPEEIKKQRIILKV